MISEQWLIICLSGHGLRKKLENWWERGLEQTSCNGDKVWGYFCLVQMSTKWQLQQTSSQWSCGQDGPICGCQGISAQLLQPLLKGWWMVGHGSRHGGYAWTQHQGLPLALDAVAATIVEYPTCQQQKVTLSHQYNNVSQVNQPATWWQFDCIWSLSSQKGKQFVLFGTDAFLERDLPSLPIMILPKPPFMTLEIALLAVGKFATVFLVNKQIILEKMKYNNRLTFMEFIVLTIYPYPLPDRMVE